MFIFLTMVFMSVNFILEFKAPECLDAAFEYIGFSPSMWKGHIIGFGADGAAVMLGQSRGVAALLKQEVPHMIEIHYGAHGLEFYF